MCIYIRTCSTSSYTHVYACMHTCQLIDKRRTLSLSHKSVGIPRVDVINRVCNDQIFANKPAPFLPIFSTGGPCWGTYGFVALNHWWQIRRFHGRWPGASLGLLVDTVSPTCQIAALLYALVSEFVRDGKGGSFSVNGRTTRDVESTGGGPVEFLVDYGEDYLKVLGGKCRCCAHTQATAQCRVARAG